MTAYRNRRVSLTKTGARELAALAEANDTLDRICAGDYPEDAYTRGFARVAAAGRAWRSVSGYSTER